MPLASAAPRTQRIASTSTADPLKRLGRLTAPSSSPLPCSSLAAISQSGLAALCNCLVLNDQKVNEQVGIARLDVPLRMGHARCGFHLDNNSHDKICYLPRSSRAAAVPVVTAALAAPQPSLPAAPPPPTPPPSSPPPLPGGGGGGGGPPPPPLEVCTICDAAAGDGLTADNLIARIEVGAVTLGVLVLLCTIGGFVANIAAVVAMRRARAFAPLALRIHIEDAAGTLVPLSAVLAAQCASLASGARVASSKFEVRRLITGRPVDAALGVIAFCNVPEEEVWAGMSGARGEKSMQRE